MARLLEQLGIRLRLARLRRRYSAELVAKRAGISRKTLFRVEHGDPAVAIGIYARVLQTLRLDQDLAQIALDDELGRRLQDADLETRLRAPRTEPPSDSKESSDPEVDAADDGEPGAG